MANDTTISTAQIAERQFYERAFYELNASLLKKKYGMTPERAAEVDRMAISNLNALEASPGEWEYKYLRQTEDTTAEMCFVMHPNYYERKAPEIKFEDPVYALKLAFMRQWIQKAFVNKSFSPEDEASLKLDFMVAAGAPANQIAAVRKRLYENMKPAASDEQARREAARQNPDNLLATRKKCIDKICEAHLYVVTSLLARI